MRTVLVGIGCIALGYGIGQGRHEPEVKLEPLLSITKLKNPSDKLFAEMLLACYRSEYAEEKGVKFSVTHKNGFVIVQSKEGDGDVLDGESSALFTESGSMVRYHLRQMDDFKGIVTKYKKQAVLFNMQHKRFWKSIR
ncbi:MAG: hypothetical protein WCI55_13460 [Armatimonadota bacterium]